MPMQVVATQLTNDEIDNIYLSLSMRKNYIMTGDPLKDQAQAAREKFPYKALTTDQMRLLVATDDLMTKLLKSKMALGGN